MVSLSEKFLLTFEEVSVYFGIGESKLRNMARLFSFTGKEHISWEL